MNQTWDEDLCTFIKTQSKSKVKKQENITHSQALTIDMVNSQGCIGKTLQ